MPNPGKALTIEAYLRNSISLEAWLRHKFELRSIPLLKKMHMGPIPEPLGTPRDVSVNLTPYALTLTLEVDPIISKIVDPQITNLKL